jgi:hypothetical protein
MSDPAATALFAALLRETSAAAKTATTPVTVQLDWIGPLSNETGDTAVRVTRVTRTLVFAEADYFIAGRRAASAAAVFAIQA